MSMKDYGMYELYEVFLPLVFVICVTMVVGSPSPKPVVAETQNS